MTDTYTPVLPIGFFTRPSTPVLVDRQARADALADLLIEYQNQLVKEGKLPAPPLATSQQRTWHIGSE